MNQILSLDSELSRDNLIRWLIELWKSYKPKKSDEISEKVANKLFLLLHPNSLKFKPKTVEELSSMVNWNKIFDNVKSNLLEILDTDKFITTYEQLCESRKKKKEKVVETDLFKQIIPNKVFRIKPKKDIDDWFEANYSKLFRNKRNIQEENIEANPVIEENTQIEFFIEENIEADIGIEPIIEQDIIIRWKNNKIENVAKVNMILQNIIIELKELNKIYLKINWSIINTDLKILKDFYKRFKLINLRIRRKKYYINTYPELFKDNLDQINEIKPELDGFLIEIENIFKFRGKNKIKIIGQLDNELQNILKELNELNKIYLKINWSIEKIDFKNLKDFYDKFKWINNKLEKIKYYINTYSELLKGNLDQINEIKPKLDSFSKKIEEYVKWKKWVYLEDISDKNIKLNKIYMKLLDLRSRIENHINSWKNELINEWYIELLDIFSSFSEIKRSIDDSFVFFKTFYKKWFVNLEKKQLYNFKRIELLINHINFLKNSYKNKKENI